MKMWLCGAAGWRHCYPDGQRGLAALLLTVCMWDQDTALVAGKVMGNSLQGLQARPLIMAPWECVVLGQFLMSKHSHP